MADEEKNDEPSLQDGFPVHRTVWNLGKLVLSVGQTAELSEESWDNIIAAVGDLRREQDSVKKTAHELEQRLLKLRVADRRLGEHLDFVRNFVKGRGGFTPDPEWTVETPEEIAQAIRAEDAAR